MGCVWSAEHLTLKTRVAVKFISSELASDPMVMQRFVSEASTAAPYAMPGERETLHVAMAALMLSNLAVASAVRPRFSTSALLKSGGGRFAPVPLPTSSQRRSGGTARPGRNSTATSRCRPLAVGS